jgi:hypothetical protein
VDEAPVHRRVEREDVADDESGEDEADEGYGSSPARPRRTPGARADQEDAQGAQEADTDEARHIVEVHPPEADIRRTPANLTDQTDERETTEEECRTAENDVSDGRWSDLHRRSDAPERPCVTVGAAALGTMPRIITTVVIMDWCCSMLQSCERRCRR